MSDSPGVFFLVDDDPHVSRALARLLGRARGCIGASDIASAMNKLASNRRRICGFVIDVKLPDGSGVDLLRLAREVAPHAPAILLTGFLDPAVVNEAYRLGAACLLKPAGRGAFSRFVMEALAAESGIDPVLRARVAHFATQRALTAPEAEILMANIAGITSEQVMAKRGITRNTYKTQVRRLLHKLGVDSLDAARGQILAELS